MKTKRKKLITVMLGIILLISQQIIAGTNYTKTVTSTGGTVSATEFAPTLQETGQTLHWNNLRIKNGATVTIDFSGVPGFQRLDGASGSQAQITSAGTSISIGYFALSGGVEKEFRINLDINYYGVPQFNGADVPSNIVITESNKNDVVSVPNIASVGWRKNSATGEVIAIGSSISLAALQASGATTFVADMDDGQSNSFSDGTPASESKYTFSITPLAPTLSVAPTAITNVAAAGESKTLTVTSNAAWTATSDQSWATLSTSSGTNNGTVNVTLAQNTGTTPRTVTLTFTAGSLTRTVTITQDGATSTLSTTLASTTNVAAAGGIAGVNVVSNTNWSITTSGLPSWVTLSTSSGTNNGTVNVTLAQNTGIAPRTVTLTFTAGSLTRTVTITQDGATPTLSVSPTTLSPTAAGGTATVTVASNVAVWSVASNQGWATVSPASGANNGTVTVTFAANTGTSPRTAKLTFSATGLPNQEVQITQPGTAPMLSVAPASITNVAAAGESKTLAVTSNAGPWTVTSDKSWATLSAPGGTNNGSITVTLAPNTGIAPRTVTLTFTAGSLTRTVTITQDGATPTLSATLASTTNVAAGGGIAGVNVVSNTNWSITTSGLPSWVTLSTSSGTNNGTVNVTLAQNTGASPRTVTLTFTAGALTRTVTITQNGTGTPPTPPTPPSPPTPSTPTLSLSIEVIRSNGNREMEEVEVSATGDWYIRTPDWISATPSSGRGNRTVTFRIEENTTGVAREAKVTVTSGSLSQTVKVYQAALNPKSQKKVAKLILSDTSVVLKEKAFYHLTVDVLPIDAASKDIVWKSSDPTIATVVNGHVTILKKGEVTITVKALDGSGVSASCKIDIQSTVGNELYPEEPRVWSDGNILYIRLVKPEQVSVYTTNGQLVLRQKMNGDSAVSLSSGIYFIRIGDQETKKVAIY